MLESAYHITEPLIHSHITDGLPDDHPMANEVVDCKMCGVMVHAFNNECMQTWVESGQGNYCLGCFVEVLKSRGEYGISVLHPGDGLAPPAKDSLPPRPITETSQRDR
jgi:hypothetical protein